MTGPGLTLSGDAAGRIVREVRDRELEPKENRRVTRPDARPGPAAAADAVVWTVEVTGPAATAGATAGLYPGVVRRLVPDAFFPATNPPAWDDLDPGACLVVPRSGPTLRVGQCGAARFERLHAGQAVYSLDEPARRGFHARLVERDPAAVGALPYGGWSFKELRITGTGLYQESDYVDSDGAAVTGYAAWPLAPTFAPVGPNRYGAPVETDIQVTAGLTVWMWEGAVKGRYEFRPVGYADAGHPGLVSATADPEAVQVLGNNRKEFRRSVLVNADAPAGSYDPFGVAGRYREPGEASTPATPRAVLSTYYTAGGDAGVVVTADLSVSRRIDATSLVLGNDDDPDSWGGGGLMLEATGRSGTQNSQIQFPVTYASPGGPLGALSIKGNGPAVHLFAGSGPGRTLFVYGSLLVDGHSIEASGTITTQANFCYYGGSTPALWPGLFATITLYAGTAKTEYVFRAGILTEVKTTTVVGLFTGTVP